MINANWLVKSVDIVQNTRNIGNVYVQPKQSVESLEGKAPTPINSGMSLS